MKVLERVYSLIKIRGAGGLSQDEKEKFSLKKSGTRQKKAPSYHTYSSETGDGGKPRFTLRRELQPLRCQKKGSKIRRPNHSTMNNAIRKESMKAWRGGELKGSFHASLKRKSSGSRQSHLCSVQSSHKKILRADRQTKESASLNVKRRPLQLARER